MNKIINLISGPRNISTAVMYSFGSRKDMIPFDEPFYAYYLNKYEVDYHPGIKDILDSQSSNPKIVLSQLNGSLEQENVFIKNMAHHLKGFDLNWMLEVENIFLIRDVRRLINSFSKVIENVTLEDIGIRREWELYQWLVNNGRDPIVVDANEVLKAPQTILSQVCGACGIEYEPQMLSWAIGPKTYDGIWAEHWYRNVHKSTTFGAAYTDEIISVNPKYQKLLAKAEKYYNKLLSKSITNATNI